MFEILGCRLWCGDRSILLDSRCHVGVPKFRQRLALCACLDSLHAEPSRPHQHVQAPSSSHHLLQAKALRPHYLGSN